MRACPPPGRGRGTGPDGDKFRRGGTQETLGGAEAKRSPEKGLCPALAKRPDKKRNRPKNTFRSASCFMHLLVVNFYWRISR